MEFYQAKWEEIIDSIQEKMDQILRQPIYPTTSTSE